MTTGTILLIILVLILLGGFTPVFEAGHFTTAVSADAVWCW